MLFYCQNFKSRNSFLENSLKAITTALGEDVRRIRTGVSFALKELAKVICRKPKKAFIADTVTSFDPIEF